MMAAGETAVPAAGAAAGTTTTSAHPVSLCHPRQRLPTPHLTLQTSNRSLAWASEEAHASPCAKECGKMNFWHFLGKWNHKSEDFQTEEGSGKCRAAMWHEGHPLQSKSFAGTGRMDGDLCKCGAKGLMNTWRGTSCSLQSCSKPPPSLPSLEADVFVRTWAEMLRASLSMSPPSPHTLRFPHFLTVIGQ